MKRRLLSTGFFIMILMGLSSLISNVDPIASDNNPDCLDSLNVPKGFTPNADSVNDVFQVNFPCPPEIFEIRVYDQFEDLVFKSKKHDFIWYGTNLQNKPCEPGVYNWKIEYTYQMKYIEISGQVLLQI